VATLDISSIIILGTLFVIFIVFLFFDIFKRNEKYGYLAYITAVIPVNYMWALGFDILIVWILLFALWDITLLRDLIWVFRKTKEYDDILLFLLLGVIIQIIITAILPADQLLSELQTNATPYWVFWLPDVYDASFNIKGWVNTSYLLIYRALATSTIILAIFPLLYDIKDEEVPFPIIIVITAIFIIPFLILSLIWYPQLAGVLTFLFSVILFIVLLIITRSGKEG
jgi:hypothetical protein